MYYRVTRASTGSRTNTGVRRAYSPIKPDPTVSYRLKLNRGRRYYSAVAMRSNRAIIIERSLSLPFLGYLFTFLTPLRPYRLAYITLLISDVPV